jgi:hypothetical protein
LFTANGGNRRPAFVPTAQSERDSFSSEWPPLSEEDALDVAGEPLLPPLETEIFLSGLPATELEERAQFSGWQGSSAAATRAIREACPKEKTGFPKETS